MTKNQKTLKQLEPGLLVLWQSDLREDCIDRACELLPGRERSSIEHSFHDYAHGYITRPWVQTLEAFKVVLSEFRLSEPEPDGNGTLSPVERGHLSRLILWAFENHKQATKANLEHMRTQMGTIDFKAPEEQYEQKLGPYVISAYIKLVRSA